MRTYLLVLGGLIGLTACFGDTQQPAPFRFECSADGDCSDPENCISGLCQIPCTYATFEDDCPSAMGFALCFNGVCSNLCSLDDDAACPKPQGCVAAPFDGGGFGGADTSNLGVCGIECSAEEGCPDQELCIEGICVPLDTGETGDTGGTGN